MRESCFASEVFAAYWAVAMTELLCRFPATRHEMGGLNVEGLNDLETLTCGAWASSQIGCIQISVSTFACSKCLF
jgi:hypothetical protein